MLTHKFNVIPINKKKTLQILFQSETGFPGWCCGKESTCQCSRHSRLGFDPRVKKIPGNRKWQPTPVFLPRRRHGQRNLSDYSSWGCKESDATEPTHLTCSRAKQGATKVPMEKINTKNTWKTLKKKRCGRIRALPDTKTHIVLTHEQTDQLTRTKSSATSPTAYGNLVHDKGGISNHWGDEKIPDTYVKTK